jgi:sulfotransferase family protein
MTSSTNTTRTSDIQATGKTIAPAQHQSAVAQEQSTMPFLGKLYRGITAPLRLLPDFLIIGTQRGGTTSLYHYLQAHPCLQATTTKEVHFFDRKYHKGLMWYRGHFPTVWEKARAQQMQKQAFVTGEASPSYLFHPHVYKRVAQALPQVKLIVLLRNPVDRAYSQYYHSIELGYESRSFEEAIRDEQQRTAQERDKILRNEHYQSYAYKHHSYLTRGIYVDQLQAWMSFFPREQFLILKSEDFYADPATALKKVYAFLNLPVAELLSQKKEYKQLNNTSYSKMDEALRTRLEEYFRPHNARLYEFLDTDFGWNK